MDACVDAAPADLIDAGEDGGTGATDDGGGCGCTSSYGPGATAGWSLPVLAVMLRRR